MNSKTADYMIVRLELAKVDLGDFEKYREDFEAYALENAGGDVCAAKGHMIAYRDEPEFRKEIFGF